MLSTFEKDIRTREARVLFVIDSALGFSSENLSEMKAKAAKMPRDQIVINEGLEIRDSLTFEQKQTIKDRISRITKNDFQYVIDHRLVEVSGHIMNDYVKERKDVLEQRDWSMDEIELTEQIINTIINVESIEKIMLKFLSNGRSLSSPTFTIVGKDEGVMRKLSIAFSNNRRGESIIAVTVLKS